jgi:hypothetical protein
MHGRAYFSRALYGRAPYSVAPLMEQLYVGAPYGRASFKRSNRTLLAVTTTNKVLMEATLSNFLEVNFTHSFLCTILIIALKWYTLKSQMFKLKINLDKHSSLFLLQHQGQSK